MFPSLEAKEAHLQVLDVLPIGRLLRAASIGEDVQYGGSIPPKAATDETLMLIAKIVADHPVSEISRNGVTTTYSVGLSGVSEAAIDRLCKATDTSELSIQAVDVFEFGELIRRRAFGMERPISYTA